MLVETYGAPERPANITVKGPEWRQISDQLDWRDVRILSDRDHKGPGSFFEILDAKRKTDQPLKDFINDQDSTSGPSVIDNMIRNILTVRRGTFRAETRFGIAVDSIVFEQLDWANLEFIRTIVFNGLSNQLPDNITVTHIELTTNDTWDTLYIQVAYNIRLKDGEIQHQQPGPDTIGGRIAYVTLNLDGVRGTNR